VSALDNGNRQQVPAMVSDGIAKSHCLGRAAADLCDVLRHLEDACEPGLLDAAYDLQKRVEAAIELEARTTTTASGVRVIRRGTAGGRTPAGGCPR